MVLKEAWPSATPFFCSVTSVYAPLPIVELPVAIVGEAAIMGAGSPRTRLSP
jgi:hypothetical protein